MSTKHSAERTVFQYPATLTIGDHVAVQTDYHGVQTGQVMRIRRSPFNGRENVLVAYVVSLEGKSAWATYIELGDAP